MIGTTKVYPLTMTSGGVSSTVAFLGGTYRAYALNVPTMTSGTDIQLAISDSASGTFRNLYLEQSLTSAPVKFNVVSGVSQALIPFKMAGEYVKVLHTTACTATSHQYSIYCMT